MNVTSSQALLQTFPKEKLISEPTPVHALPTLSKLFGIELYTKREDLTDHVGYGGNKVRNLEFLLGQARKDAVEEIVTIAPYGSNFAAAMASQARRSGFRAQIYHFTPAMNSQLFAHGHFTASQGAKLNIFCNRLLPRLSLLQAGASYFYNELGRKSSFIPIGGSNLIGALGHVNAALEFALQIEKKEIPKPDFVYVGAGTCGTIAGLMVGLALANLKVELVAVRCVDSLVCNRMNIVRIANAVAKKLKMQKEFKISDVNLVDPPGFTGYANIENNAAETSKIVWDSEKLVVDSTYTSKVLTYLFSQAEALAGKRAVYWHTFSPRAVIKPGFSAHM